MHMHARTHTHTHTHTHTRTLTHSHTDVTHRTVRRKHQQTHAHVQARGRRRAYRTRGYSEGLEFWVRYLSPYPYSGLQRRTHSSLDFIVTMPSSHPLITCPTPTWRRTTINFLQGEMQKTASISAGPGGQTSADHAVAITVAKNGHC
jgi:hypothetical protein